MRHKIIAVVEEPIYLVHRKMLHNYIDFDSNNYSTFFTESLKAFATAKINPPHKIQYSTMLKYRISAQLNCILHIYTRKYCFSITISASKSQLYQCMHV